MYEAMDLEALRDMVAINQAAPVVNMREWWCGTSGCLVGNYCVARREDILQLVGSAEYGCRVELRAARYTKSALPFCAVGLPAVAIRFGISMRAARHLFIQRVFTDSSPGTSGTRALNRLAQAVTYFERKRAMWRCHEDWMAQPKRVRREAKYETPYATTN